MELGTEVLRTAEGRFLKGHSTKSSGRPSKHAFYQAIYDKEFNKKEFICIIRKLYDLAIEGDIKAIDMMLNRFLGKIKFAEDAEIQQDSHTEFLQILNDWRNKNGDGNGDSNGN
jgi:hypothetical protein